MNEFDWTMMVGGLAFFFFGLQTARDGLQLAAGERLKLLMGRITNNRFMALGLGALVTIILQSSSATTVILVSFAETQLITLFQAIGVILGADIGTTLVVVLLSFKKITKFALVIFAIGLALENLSKKQQTRYIGSIILGFGLIFFGMHLMSSSAIPLRESEMATTIFAYLGDHPYMNLLFATIFTGVVQASAATIGLAIALSFSGTLSFEASIPIVLGANIGTCITAGLACLGMKTAGRRVATAHVMIKILGVIMVMPFLTNIAGWVNNINDFISMQTTILLPTSGKIAMTHLLFNVFIAIFFLPFIAPLVKLVKRIVPESKELKEGFAPKYLDKSALESPPLAFAQAKHEILRISKIAKEMFSELFDMFKNDEDIEAAIKDIQSKDDRIDMLEKAVRFYLSKISQRELTEEQGTQQIALITIAGEYENIGDYISKDILALARKKQKKISRFSDEGWTELQQLHKKVAENFDLAVTMLMHSHEDIVRKAIRNNEEIKEMEQDLRASHMQRLHEKRIESYETSTIHLDLLSQFRAINYRLLKTIGMVSEMYVKKD
ncbi:MAG: Na/Pi cotransporter family protein [bacterium]|nr:Na/Pi cotransporter family protein [bacterium]MBU1917521.1 Na/Pi cotransporter family protein [bacterium]